jgi:hypothetical protein
MPGNPFRGYLQAYLENTQAQHRQELAEKAHELATKQLEETHQYHQAELKRQQAELDFNKNVAAQTLKQHLMEHIASGIQQPPESAGLNNPSVGYDVSQTQTGPQPGEEPTIQNLPQTHTMVGPTSAQSQGYNYTLSPEDLGGLAGSLSRADRQISVASPERMNELAAQKTGAVKGAEVQAEMPKMELEVGGRLTAAQIAAQQRAKTAEDTNVTRKYVADTNAAARKYAADMNAGNKTKVNEQELGDTANNVATGNADLPTGANGIHVQSILRQNGQVPLGKKNGGDRLDALNDLDGLVNDMNTAANMLPDSGSSVTNAVQQTGNKLISHLPWQTDLKNNMASVKAKAPGIVRAIGGVGSGRVTNVEIQAQMDNLINAGMNKQQALGKIAQFERDTYTKAYSDILGAAPTKQKIAALAAHGGLDRWRNVRIAVRDPRTGQTTETPVIKKMPNNREAIWDTNSNQYKDIEDYK